MPIVYDTGILIAAESKTGGREAWAIHKALLASGQVPLVPTVVLAQVWRGGPQAELSRMLKGCEVIDVGEETARSAGELLNASGTSDAVDAIVMAVAASSSSSVVTSDPKDMQLLEGFVPRRVSVTPF